MGLLRLAVMRRPIVPIVALCLLAGMRIGGAQTGPTLTPLKFSLDGRTGGAEAAFVLAQDRGYFKAEGLDVGIDQAAQPIEPIARVAGGGYDLAFADINAMIRYRDQHPTAPIKAVLMVYSTPPYAVVARKSRGIDEPRQLEGKRLGAPPASATFQQWPLFAKLNGIDTTKVTMEQIGIPVRAPMLAAGQIDAALGASFRLYVDLKDRGVPVGDIVLMPMASYGLKLYGNALVVNTKLAAERPEVVSAFLRAALRGLKETIRRPGDAVEAVARRDDGTKREVELERLRMAIRDNIVTPEARAIGLGAIERSRLEEAIDQLALVNGFKAKPKPDDIFDPTFLPPAADRRIP